MSISSNHSNEKCGKREWLRKLRLLGLLFCLSPFVVWGILRLSSPPKLYEGKSFSRLIFDRQGKLLDISVASDGRYRSRLDFKEIPDSCIEAAITFEDQNYYYHPGVDPLALLRAGLSLFGARPVGGSTITMQLVRIRSGLNTKSFSGKLKQIWQALMLERHYTKQELLEVYFNLAPYGGGIEGIATASAIYFGKPVSKLSRAECAALAVLPQAPTKRFAFKNEGFSRAFLRLAKNLNIPVSEQSINLPSRADIEPPHFARHLTQKLLSASGSVFTTVDKVLQTQLETLLHNYIVSSSGLGLRNGALLVADGRSGEVLGYVGSKNFSDVKIQGFVDGVMARRSPGSLLKPFIYAKAIDEGLIVPDSMLTDIPIKLTSYEPENFERNFLGLVTARDALVKSRNVPALLLNSKLKEKGLYALLNQAGVYLRQNEDYYGAAVVLGGVEMSLFDVVRLYSAFVSGGEIVPLRLTSQNPLEAARGIFSAESVFLTRQMMTENPAPVGYSDRSLAWKTGTSSGGRDAWAVGIKGSVIVGVWLGNFDGQANPNFIGRDLAGPLLFRVFEQLGHTSGYAGRLNIQPGSQGLNLGSVLLCPKSGMLHTENCPHAKRGMIIPGVSPIKTCEVHRGGVGSEPVLPSEVETHLLSVGLKFGGHYAKSSLPKTPPRIVTPEESVEYRVEYGKEVELEFRANVDGEASRVYWYVNGELVGDSAPTSSVFWTARSGIYTVTVSDSFGMSDGVRIKVVPQEN